MIKNVLLISADFPSSYYQFAKAFKNNGCNVFVIGSTPYGELHQELKNNITEYYQSFNMENIDAMSDAINYLINKYGQIDFLESNNEYWLRSDSILRERFGITSGLYPYQLDEYQKKSSMKKAFLNAGAHVAPYLIVRDYDSLKEFANKFGYPLFAKPDIGVGAFGNYKINNENELGAFYREKPYVDYICEPFVTGITITFDGIANANSEVVVCANEIFPREIYSLHITKQDMFYYVNKEMPEELFNLGKNIIKTLGLKNRFFHTEFFLAENSVPGFFNKGDIVPLEVNIRTPGGYTPDLLNYGLSINLYQVFADIVCFGKTNLKTGTRYYACAASRRNGKEYFFKDEDILRTYKNEICQYGGYPDVFADLMGNRYFMAKLNSEEDVKIFKEYVSRLVGQRYVSHESFSRVVGEDKRILEEQNSKSEYDDLSICDKHIDGA